MRRSIRGMGLAISLALCATAQAIPITWEYSALTRERGLDSFSIYEPQQLVTGTFTFESSTPDDSGGIGFYPDAILSATAAIGGDTYSWSNIVMNGDVFDRNYISVVDCDTAFRLECYYQPGLDQYEATILDNANPDGSITMRYFQILAAAPSDSDIFTSTALPTLLDLDRLQTGDPIQLIPPYALIGFGDIAPSGGLGSITATLTSLHVESVPEPATLGMFAVGLLAMLLARRGARSSS